MPGIHVFGLSRNTVDGRDKPGHDGSQAHDIRCQPRGADHADLRACHDLVSVTAIRDAVRGVVSEQIVASPQIGMVSAAAGWHLMCREPDCRHGRACPGHPRWFLLSPKTWMPGIADKFTQSAQGRLLWPA